MNRSPGEVGIGARTGVLEYRDFLSALGERPPGTEVSGSGACVMVMELEGLRDVDGSLGYPATDVLIRRAAQAVANALPESTIGVTGRHQLACVLPRVNGPGFAELAAHKILRVLGEPLAYGERQVVLWPRLGVALANARIEDLRELLASAYGALRHARRERARLYMQQPGTTASLLDTVDIWGELAAAVEEGSLHLEYQPQVHLESGRVASLEALLRWEHPRYGVIPPNVMIGAAEGTDLMPRLTHWVLNTALRQCATYRQAGLIAGLSVNFSADDLQEQELPALVEQALEVWRVPAEVVTVELTETAVMESHDIEARDTLEQIKALGLRISMDDFGIGYSSMGRLLRMPLDELKIDMTFVHELTSSRAHQSIVESMIGLGHQLGLKVVAEGVEDAETLEHLRALASTRLRSGPGFPRRSPSPSGTTAGTACKRHAPDAPLNEAPCEEGAPAGAAALVSENRQRCAQN